MESLVSVIIPLYNGIEYLEESLSSIYQQTIKQFEVIIAINGHPLNSEIYLKTLEIVGKLEKQYDIIKDKTKVIDMGLLKGRKSEALNNSIKQCECDYICMLDVDDIWEPDKLEHQLVMIPYYDIVGTSCIYFGDLHGCPRIPTCEITNFDFMLYNPIVNSSFMVKKSIFENGLIWNEENLVGLEDYEFWLDCRFIYQLKIFNVPQFLVKHRVHNKSSFNNSNQNHLEEFKKNYLHKINNCTVAI